MIESRSVIQLSRSEIPAESYIFYLRQSDAAIDIEPLPGNISAPVGKQMLSAMRREHGPEFSLLHQEDIRLRDLK